MWLMVNGLIQNVRNVHAVAYGFIVFFRVSRSTKTLLTVDCLPPFVLNPRCLETNFVKRVFLLAAYDTLYIGLV
jgi:hypothetical protein